MPLGSSSAAPVVSPGPSAFQIRLTVVFVPDIALSLSSFALYQLSTQSAVAPLSRLSVIGPRDVRLGQA